MPEDARPATGVSATQGGGNKNTQIAIVVTDIPAGVTLTFPTASIVGTNLSGGASAGQLDLLPSLSGVVGTTQTVVFDFNTARQNTSDINTEIFVITPTVGLPTTLVLT